MLEPAEDATPAHWLTRAAGEVHTLHVMVPDVFDAYARVFHPALLADKEVRWADVADANERAMHGGAEWGSLTGSRKLNGQEELWDREPNLGQLPARLARRLAEILAGHTSTPERCFFAVWEGWGVPHVFVLGRDITEEERERIEAESQQEVWDWDSFVRCSPTFGLPHRGYHLLEAPLAEIDRFYRPHNGNASSILRPDAPSIWWPEDCAWCVGGDTDLMTTYLGGTAASVEAVVGDAELEALEIPAGQSVTWDADTVNPLPRPPR
jgi:hypothetical protein